MTRDDIIRLAREAGAFPELSATPEKDVVFLKRFAALVAAAERTVCAQLVVDLDGGLEWVAKEIRARSKK